MDILIELKGRVCYCRVTQQRMNDGNDDYQFHINFAIFSCVPALSQCDTSRVQFKPVAKPAPPVPQMPMFPVLCPPHTFSESIDKREVPIICATILHLTFPPHFKKHSLFSGSVVRRLVGMAGETSGSALVPLSKWWGTSAVCKSTSFFQIPIAFKHICFLSGSGNSRPQSFWKFQ